VPGAKVRDVVAWTVDPNTAWRAWDVVLHDFLLTPASHGLPFRKTAQPANPGRGGARRLPADPDAIVWLGDLWIARSGGDQRPLYLDWPSLPLHVSQRAPGVETSAIPGQRRYLPLDRLRVTSANSLDRGDRRQARSLWSLSVTGGDEDLDTFDIQSTWLTLAYLGALAGWPEPPRV